MKLGSIHGLALLAAMGASNVAAAPIDFTTGITTGVFHLTNLGPDLKDGVTITFPYAAYLATKPYSDAQLVPTGSDEEREAFVAVGGDKSFGFASALSTGNGVLEVGVANGLRAPAFDIAVSRYYTTIKNNTDEAIDFDFFFEIEPARLGVQGVRDDHNAHALVGATIDYVLRTPDGGSFVDTSDRLFTYFVDIDFDDAVTSSDNSNVIEVENSAFLLEYATSPFTGSVDLPTIPGRGELTYYYDMLAVLDVRSFEIGGFALIGDPTDLVGGAPGRLVQQPTGPTQVPEPATALLLCVGLAAIGALRRH
jgi:hypothetical protein